MCVHLFINNILHIHILFYFIKLNTLIININNEFHEIQYVFIYYPHNYNIFHNIII